MGTMEITVNKVNNLIENQKWGFIDKHFSFFARSKLKNKDFSIIGNNCIVGGIYHKFGLKFTSPTIWSFFYPEEYIKFLENLEWYLNQRLEFTSKTKHPSAIKLSETMNRNYPIGILGGDVEIHFIHYLSEEEASEKWSKRVKRVNFNNLFIIFSDSEKEFKEELLVRFERLPFTNKIFFSSKDRNSKATIFVEDYAGESYVLDSTRNRKYEKYLDLIKWLNCEKDFKRKRVFSPLI